MKLSEIKSNPNNPRIIRDEMFNALVKSLKDFPKMMEVRPIVVDQNGMIMGGNQRFRALQELGYKEVPDSWIKKYEHFTAEEWQEFVIKDNIGFGQWNWEQIGTGEWADTNELNKWGFEIDRIRKTEGLPQSNSKKLEDSYSQEIGKVLYEPKQTNHKPFDLYSKSKTFDKEINEIENAEIRELLKIRAAYFVDLNFSKIADYYAYQASEKEKRIFEKLALVLLDKDQLIENGFSDLMDELDKNEYE